MNNSQFKQQVAQNQSKNQNEILHCKKCGTTLSSDDKFCPECGEKVGGIENTCRWCGNLTTKEICPECGKRLFAQVCKKCGKETYFDICEHCGEVLSQFLAQALQEEKCEIKEMSGEEAKKIIEEFKESENAELEYFRKKLHEHDVLLAEKTFFEDREKRITEVFGENPTDIRYPTPEEIKFLQEASKGIKQLALQKEQEAIQAAIEKKIPGAKSVEEEHQILLDLINQKEQLLKKLYEEKHEETIKEIAEEMERRRIEEERRRKELEELQRRIEEQRKREEAIARERRRQELIAFNNRIRGTYVSVHNCVCGGYNHEEIKLSFNIDENGRIYGKSISKTVDYCGYGGGRFAGCEYVTEFVGSFDGNNVNFHDEKCYFLNNPGKITNDDFLHSFSGTLNSDGSILNGYWFSEKKSNRYCDYRKY